MLQICVKVHQMLTWYEICIRKCICRRTTIRQISSLSWLWRIQTMVNVTAPYGRTSVPTVVILSIVMSSTSSFKCTAAILSITDFSINSSSCSYDMIIIHCCIQQHKCLTLSTDLPISCKKKKHSQCKISFGITSLWIKTDIFDALHGFQIFFIA